MFNSEFKRDQRIAIHTGSGEVSVESILSANAYWFNHPDFDPGLPVLWDIREGQLAISMDEMSAMYSLVRSALGEKKRTGGRTAWVHSSALTRAIIDVVGEEFDWGSEWKAFSDISDATAWCLGEVSVS